VRIAAQRLNVRFTKEGNAMLHPAAPQPSATCWPWHNTELSPEARAELILAAMTLEEKLAQLGSFWPRAEEDKAAEGNIAPLEDEMSDSGTDFAVASEHGLGHLTRVFGSRPTEVGPGIDQLLAYQNELTTRTRLGIPAIAHEECLTGLTALGATVYPAPIAWGATWSPELIEEMATAIGRDMSSLGLQQGLAPLLDVVRDYRWGRVEETVGEDPYLVGSIGTAYVRGLQSTGVIATLKHFAGYPASRAARNHGPVSMGPREFADIMLTPFEMAVREGRADSVMNSYSDVDGIPAATDHSLLTRTLRENWGFEGTVVSDYWSIAFVHTMHKVARTLGEAGAATLAAGIDVELPETAAFRELAPLVDDGTLPISVIDRAVRRVLTQKARLGLLDANWAPPSASADDIDLDSPANRAIARNVAEKSIILLANDAGLLPLRTPPASIAVVGPIAVEPRSMFGCYSFPNHVLVRYGGGQLGVEVTSILDAVRGEFPAARIDHVSGVPIMAAVTEGIGEAVEAARRADLVLLTVGDVAGLFGRGTSGEGCDTETLDLPGAQPALVDAVLSTGTPTVLIVISGRPYALGAYASRAAAIVQAFMPGEEGAEALAHVLSGAVNPSGKLPVSIPAGTGIQPSTYLAPPLGRWSDGISNLDPTPLYPFGHGLSYTAYEYSDLRLTDHAIAPDGMLTAGVSVRNTGPCAGDEIVQVYLSDHYAQVTRPVRQLVGFARVSLAPGEEARVEFDLHADRTAFTGIDPARRIVEPGTFTLSVGRSSEDLALTEHFEIVGEVRDATVERVLSTPARVVRA
jgi:beta-glucosidase